jgi:hypothetical protein
LNCAVYPTGPCGNACERGACHTPLDNCRRRAVWVLWRSSRFLPPMRQ